MLSRTHLSIGVATALIIVHPNTPASLFTTIASGALGGVTADVDAVKRDYQADALTGQIVAISLVGILLVVDYFFKFGIIQELCNEYLCTIAGGISYLVLYIIGYITKHRTFTHSILAMILFTLSIGFFYSQMMIPFMIGYITHLLLDILNKKPVPLFYPFGKGVCLKLCSASKKANLIFMIIGMITSVAMIINLVLKMV